VNLSRALLSIVVAGAFAAPLAGCGRSAGTASAGKDQIVAVGAENQYANVISQIGGTHVAVTAVESNPNADPHTFEASPSVAQQVGAARLVVQSGLGYDTYMNKIESAQPSSSRRVIDVQKLLGLPDSTPNPHLWYDPATMPAVAQAVAADLSALQPSHAAYFAANERRFNASLAPWLQALKQFGARYRNTPVAVSEPVANYMLRAAGAKIMTPFTLQASVMNGVDPAAQDVTLQKSLFTRRKVKAFLYNPQVTDSLTDTFLAAARKNHVPVVGVYETMPVPGYSYQSWMLAEVAALRRAVAQGVSTERLR
jgi:zinc/manganese transport system substrate-binding protein